MTRRASDRLEDMTEAIAAIRSHVTKGSLDTGLVFDAVRVRVIEIGEAVKNLDANLLALEPSVPWSDIARMRDLLAHHYFDTNHAVVRHVVEDELDTLEEAVRRLMAIAQRLDSDAGEFA